ncbi:triosephosphate isomerase [Erysipelotrichaceae bacterium]|nr:triosephosphate isomerase [Erysipelotrichaceae bacterium]
MRKPIIAGNWKMFKTGKEVANFIKATSTKVPTNGAESVICVPAVYLEQAQKLVAGTNLVVAAQNMHFEEAGAFTGEISPVMLADLKIKYVVLGHSERRAMFNETDQTVNLKAHAAFKHGILPIICVGESLEERETNVTNQIVGAQTMRALAGLAEADLMQTVIAYEPIWAIGTGKTATSDQAQETIKGIRATIEAEYGSVVAEAVRIQYGGSVKPENVAELLGKADIDGALVGGAALEAESFLGLFNF